MSRQDKELGRLRMNRTGLTRCGLFLVIAASMAAASLRPMIVEGQSQTRQEVGSNVTWQGVLHAGSDLRIVVKVEPVASGVPKVTFYSIDQTGQPFPASGVEVDGGRLNFTVGVLNGTYEGKIAPDKETVAGTWKQGAASFPLNLQRVTEATAFEIPAPPVPPKAMDAKVDPSFSVATIKPSKPDQPGMLYGFPNRHFTSINTSLADLISIAYDLQATQIRGGPAWMIDDKYDLSALPDEDGEPSLKQWKVMIQKLLADRFLLRFHMESRSLPAYVLTVGKRGARLKASEGYKNNFPGLLFEQFGVLSVHNGSMDDFAHIMQSVVLDRPVVDETKLKGRWDFTLKWTPDDTQFKSMGVKMPVPSDAADAPPSLPEAIEEQLGLRIEATKSPVPVLVIDRVNKPSPN